MKRSRLSRKSRFSYKIVQGGSLIGEVRNPAKATELIMFDSTMPAKVYRGGKVVGSVSVAYKGYFRKARK